MRDKSKILLVDDEPGMQRYIKTLLEIDDHHVETASTGEQAVELVQNGMEPNLVLLDLLMPGIDGLETLEKLRKLQPNIKVVMLSCVNDTKKVVQAIRLGAVDYITKPFQKAELDAVIDQCLGTNQQNYSGEIEDLGDETVGAQRQKSKPVVNTRGGAWTGIQRVRIPFDMFRIGREEPAGVRFET